MFARGKILTEIKSVVEVEGTSSEPNSPGYTDLIIEGYANTITKDRMGDVIPKSAWEDAGALANYLKNPIILAYHNHSKPIGSMVEHEVTDFGLKITARISRGAGDVYDLIKDGVLKTFSVGFNILDAEYNDRLDTYFINKVELHEVSVVSVPANQDSVFSVAKSMESEDFEKFKQDIKPNKAKGKIDMTEEEMRALLADMQGKPVDVAGEVTKALKAAKAAEVLAAAAKAQLKLDQDAATKAVTKTATDAAKALVEELETKLAAKDGLFGEMVKANNEQIIALKDEIAQVVASRSNGFNALAAGVQKGLTPDAMEKEIDNLVFLGTIKKMDMFDTKYGMAHKAVSDSSSIAVSSDGYETIFATNLMRDVQARLVVAPLFKEMVMNAANLTIPINPARTNANWVSAAHISDNAEPLRTGAEITVTLTEKTLKTFKLAAKTFLTEETEEDAILSLVPILRAHLVESHVVEMDRAFLVGSGSGQPKGLVTQANAVAASAQTYVSAAKADGSVKVTALGIFSARRKLGLYGIDVKDISLIISQDAYWDLILDPEWADVQQVGSVSTKLNGEVGNIYGMKVIVSDHFATKAVDVAYGVMVNTSNFVVARQRGMTLRSDFDIQLDRTVFVATQRINLEPLIEASAGNGKGVVEIVYAAT